jgi:2-polyprenyl-3-methyl-5-hydroxy-6-metoxy-1,4-benzoquinol methylase
MANADPTIERLKERGWRDVATINEAFASGEITDEEWHSRMASLIRPAYLAADNAWAQAGHSGDAETWKASRGFLAAALHKNGTFLDVGCAGGILMESVQQWGIEKHLAIEPYGLDIVPELADLARNRLPHWSHRIHVGNIRFWQPAQIRFDFVLIRPEYAPESRRRDMVRHVLQNVLAPNGRLIIFVGVEEKHFRTVESSICTSGLEASGRAEIAHSEDNRVVRRLFWIDR